MTFKDVTGLVNYLRVFVQHQKITYMRHAARIVETMHARILELAKQGLRNNDLIAEITSPACAEQIDNGGDYSVIGIIQN